MRVLQDGLMNKEGSETAEEEQLQDAQKKLAFAEREANDLRELHLSATFLTPFAVAATQDNQVWLSNNERDYKDHSKQGRTEDDNSSSMSEHVFDRPCVLSLLCLLLQSHQFFSLSHPYRSPPPREVFTAV